MVNGNQVASTNVAGAASPSQILLSALASGVSRTIDLELADRERVLADRAELDAAAARARVPVVKTGFADVIANLTPIQWGMLGVAGLLTVGLAAGWFR